MRDRLKIPLLLKVPLLKGDLGGSADRATQPTCTVQCDRCTESYLCIISDLRSPLAPLGKGGKMLSRLSMRR